MWLRRKGKGADQSSPEGRRRLAEARRARETTEESLAEVCGRRGEVRDLTTSLRGHRQRNGFAEMFAQALKEGR